MNEKVLEFVTFAIGSVAEKLHKSPAEIYNIFMQADIINGYLVPAYDVLHTFSRQYLVNEMIDVMQERGIKIC